MEEYFDKTFIPLFRDIKEFNSVTFPSFIYSVIPHKDKINDSNNNNNNNSSHSHSNSNSSNCSEDESQAYLNYNANKTNNDNNNNNNNNNKNYKEKQKEDSNHRRNSSSLIEYASNFLTPLVSETISEENEIRMKETDRIGVQPKNINRKDLPITFRGWFCANFPLKSYEFVNVLKMIIYCSSYITLILFLFF